MSKLKLPKASIKIINKTLSSTDIKFDLNYFKRILSKSKYK